MGDTIWHCHLAVSLDGKIARPDGSVDDWLADYPAEDFGIDTFLAGVDAILMGRGTYEAVRHPHPTAWVRSGPPAGRDRASGSRWPHRRRTAWPPTTRRACLDGCDDTLAQIDGQS